MTLDQIHTLENQLLEQCYKLGIEPTYCSNNYPCNNLDFNIGLATNFYLTVYMEIASIPVCLLRRLGLPPINGDIMHRGDVTNCLKYYLKHYNN